MIGQSFGGMLAAELAAAYPGLFSRLVLLDPIGLWHDDAPVANWIAAASTKLPGLLFADPTGGAAQAMLALPEDPDALATAQAALVWNLGATGKLTRTRVAVHIPCAAASSASSRCELCGVAT